MKQWGVYADYSYTPNPDLKGWSNDHPFPPERIVDVPYRHQREEGLTAKMQQVAAAAVKAKQPDERWQAAFADWQASARTALDESADGWHVLAPVAIEADRQPARKKRGDKSGHRRGGAKKGRKTDVEKVASRTIERDEGSEKQPFTKLADGSVLLTGRTAGNELSFALDAPTVAMIRVELLPNDRYDGSILRPRRTTAQIKLVATLESPDGKQTNLPFHYAEADLRQPRYSGGSEILGILGGWTTSAADVHRRQTGVWTLERAAAAPAGSKLTLELPLEALGCVRVSVAPVVVLQPLKRDALLSIRKALAATAPTSAVASASATHIEAANAGLIDCAYLLATGFDSKAFGECRRLDRDFLECRDGKSPTVVTVAWKPRITRVLPRGNWQDTSGAVVVPGTPHFLPQLPNPTGRRLTRLDLAKWLVAPENPLTARVIVNRIWKQFFGAGLSATVDDFGSQGDPPTYPELLDWLSAEFRDSGWNVKHLVKLIVMSRAYRQDSNPSPELLRLDPANHWLARQSPRRLEAEFVRDQALFAAGLLNLDVGGPSVHPYQPAGYYANLQFPNRVYRPDQDDRQYRRGVYMHWQRTFLHPMLANFDAPSREECTASRVISNTPQQALTLLNDPTFVEAARVFAQSLLSDGAASDGAAARSGVFAGPFASAGSAAEGVAAEILGHRAELLPRSCRRSGAIGARRIVARAGRGEFARIGGLDERLPRVVQLARDDHPILTCASAVKRGFPWHPSSFPRRTSRGSFSAARFCASRPMAWGASRWGNCSAAGWPARPRQPPMPAHARARQPLRLPRRENGAASSIRPIFPSGRGGSFISAWRAGPSHLETFDNKPELKRINGQPFPASFTKGQQLAQLQNARLRALGPFTGFKKYGKSGQEISDLFPHIGGIADDICIIRSMHTEQINHDPAQAFMNSGSQLKGRPSMGSWLLYGLGARGRRSARLRRLHLARAAWRAARLRPAMVERFSAQQVPGHPVSVEGRRRALRRQSRRREPPDAAPRGR